MIMKQYNISEYITELGVRIMNLKVNTLGIMNLKANIHEI